MSARLTVLVGAGGVGKTTLAAAYALACARAGGRVGLLGIDPSRRLQGALGLALSDLEAPISGAPSCRAAILAPAEALRRWAEESCGENARASLLANPFFLALADRLATASDVIAAVRVGEWIERDPELTELVVDTAPGLNAIEFLRRPRHLAAFLEGDLVRWLRGDSASRRTKVALRMRVAARLVVGGLGRVGGARLLRDFAEFLSAIEQPIERMLARVATARRLVEQNARVLLVTAVRDDAAETAASIAAALCSIGVPPSAAILNRAVPTLLDRELAALDPASLTRGEVVLARYARTYAATQARVLQATLPLAPSCIVVPAARGLGEIRRLDALADLGDSLREQLAHG